MGHLLILTKNNSIIADFNDQSLFTNFICAALYQDAQHYYVTLIPRTTDSDAEETLIKHWQPYIVSTFASVHGSTRQPVKDTDYQYVLKQYPIVNLPAIQQFYSKHHGAKLDEFMLDYCRRYIDFDYIDAEHKSLFVFSKNLDSEQPQTPIDQFPGAEQFPEFLTDLHKLVSEDLKTPTKLSQLACIDNQRLTKSFSPTLFHPKPKHAADPGKKPSLQP